MTGEEEGADADSAPWIAVLVWCGKKVNFCLSGSRIINPDQDRDLDLDQK